jgi:hypothetical protein
MLLFSFTLLLFLPWSSVMLVQQQQLSIGQTMDHFYDFIIKFPESCNSVSSSLSSSSSSSSHARCSSHHILFLKVLLECCL